MKNVSMLVAFILGSMFTSVSIAETSAEVKPSIFMDVKQVVSDTPTVLLSGNNNYHRCQNEYRTMVFRDSSGALKTLNYQVNNNVGCSDGDGGTNWGS